MLNIFYLGLHQKKIGNGVACSQLKAPAAISQNRKVGYEKLLKAFSKPLSDFLKRIQLLFLVLLNAQSSILSDSNNCFSQQSDLHLNYKTCIVLSQPRFTSSQVAQQFPFRSCTRLVQAHINALPRCTRASIWNEKDFPAKMWNAGEEQIGLTCSASTSAR